MKRESSSPHRDGPSAGAPRPLNRLHRGARSVLVGVLAGAALFGILLIWSVATARYAGPDEPAHVLRVASVAAGDLLGDPVPSLPAGYRRVPVAAALTTGDPTCFRHDDDIPATCAFAAAGAKGIAAAASSAGTYPPYYYALVGVPVRLFGDVADVGWYRAVAAFWCALVLTLTTWRSRRIGVVLLIGSITPAAWFLFGVVNPNALEIALAILAWTGIERERVQRGSIRDVAWISAPIALAILIRPVAALAWVAMVGAWVILIDRADPDRGAGGSRTARRRLVFLGPPVGAIVGAIAWNLWASVDFSDARTAENVSVGDAVSTAADQLTETAREMVGSLGWLEFSAPWIAHAAWWAMFTLVAAIVWRSRAPAVRPSLRQAWAWVLVVTAGAPVLFEVVFANDVGFIWQGRYSISAAMGLVILGLSAVHDRLTPRARMSVAGVAGIGQVATLWIVLQRYTVGAHGSMWFRGAAWHPPLAPVLLVTLDALLVVCLIALAAQVDRTRLEPDRSAQRSSEGAFGHLAPHHVER